MFGVLCFAVTLFSSTLRQNYEVVFFVSLHHGLSMTSSERLRPTRNHHHGPAVSAEPAPSNTPGEAVSGQFPAVRGCISLPRLFSLASHAWKMWALDNMKQHTAQYSRTSYVTSSSTVLPSGLPRGPVEKSPFPKHHALAPQRQQIKSDT